uniref:Reverse transcriptase domain-containing protein n=1 Tax=Tanacetum cinerariifolium TaxID=118510 RepID=A0A6L2JW81_TANCI|nr:reverse transcriptase domain-containing protein [Tanacetum cinerariifolium]
MPNNVKTYDGTGDPEDHVKIFQAAAQKHVKDPVEIHNIKQKDGETIEDFMERFKVETGRMKGAPECMRISGFIHGVNNPELTKQLNEHVPKTMEEMMITTTAFIRGEAAAASKKKASSGVEGPLVTEVEMGGHMIHHMYVDGGSSMEILYEHCFNRLWPKIKNQMVPATTSLTGFSGENIWPLGQLRLLVIIGDADHSTRSWMNFMIVRSLSPYNGIIGRPRIREIQSVPSTAHGMLKFPVEEGIVTIRSTILIPAECISVITSSVIQLAEPDEEKTAFHNGQGMYCYTKMPFGLKNDGATYQRLVDKAFNSQIGRNIEVYVDDLVVKSYTEAEMLRDVDEMFCTLRKINMKLNPKKSPKPKEELIVYLSATYGAISAVLMTERGACGLDDRKRSDSDANLLNKLSITGPRTKLYSNGKASSVTSLRSQETSEVFPSASYHSHYRSTHQANHGSSRRGRTTAKIKRHARRTQYHVPAKNISERTDPSGFSFRNARRKSASRASGRNSTRAVDTLHGWIIMCGWVWCWAYTDKPRGNRVYLHAEISMKYQTLKRKPQTEAQATKNMMIYLRNMAGFKMDYFKGMKYDEIRPIFEKYFNSNVAFLEKIKEQLTEEESRALKRKTESQAEKEAKKQKLYEKVPVVDYDIYTENNKPYFKIIRADETHQLFLSFLRFLRNFDREYLEVLWELVKERFASSKPKNFSDDVLIITLTYMFEKPNVEAQVWKSQRGIYGLAKVKSWKLLESCGVHIITLITTQMILLVEKRYPLTRFTLDQMLNNVRLEVEEESKVSLELLRVVRQQQQEGFRPE